MGYRAVVCKALGDVAKGPESSLRLEVADVVPSGCGPNDVRISVAACGVNFADILMLQGKYQEKPALPFVPGAEVSGRVAEVGSSVKGLSPGDAVVAITSGGGYASEAVVPESACLPIPAGVDLQEAAGAPVAFGTAHVALAERAQVRRGQTVLVLGAAGGVGLAAVQVAKAMGADVIAVARGAAKGRAVRQAGADLWLDSGAAGFDLRTEVRKRAPAGVDVLFDTVGGRAFDAAVRCLNWGAQVLLIGFASGTIPRVAANIALVKNLTLHGVYWGMYLKHRPQVLRDSLAQILAWISEGRLKVPVCGMFALEDVQQAAALLFNREAIGKVLLIPGKAAAARL